MSQGSPVKEKAKEMQTRSSLPLQFLKEEQIANKGAILCQSNTVRKKPCPACWLQRHKSVNLHSNFLLNNVFELFYQSPYMACVWSQSELAMTVKLMEIALVTNCIQNDLHCLSWIVQWTLSWDFLPLLFSYPFLKVVQFHSCIYTPPLLHTLIMHKTHWLRRVICWHSLPPDF